MRSVPVVVLVWLFAATGIQADIGPIPLWEGFRRLKAPETGRTAVQLTEGQAFCYPLYFYVPSITRDGKYLVYHRAEKGRLQLHRLNLRTGESVQLTHADYPDTRWRPWGVDSGRGVLDHRSVLNVPRNLAVYFNGNEVRAVDVETLEDRRLFEIPADREPIGQNATTPDGNWLLYIHAPRGSEYGKPCRGAVVAAYHFDTGRQRELTRIDAAIDHVVAYDNRHVIFAHPANSSGIMMTDFHGGRYVRLRQGDPGVRGRLVHSPVTRRGIAYEVPELMFSGLYDPLTRRRFEFRLPPHFTNVHTGRDPEGRLWFYENDNRRKHGDGDVHDLWALVKLDPEHGDRWLRLTGNWRTYGGGQKAHFHPQLTPDRHWILFTGGDRRTNTNHIFLLDVSDIGDSQGISPDLLSPTGANDLTKERGQDRGAEKSAKEGVGMGFPCCVPSRATPLTPAAIQITLPVKRGTEKQLPGFRKGPLRACLGGAMIMH